MTGLLSSRMLPELPDFSPERSVSSPQAASPMDELPDFSPEPSVQSPKAASPMDELPDFSPEPSVSSPKAASPIDELPDFSPEPSVSSPKAASPIDELPDFSPEPSVSSPKAASPMDVLSKPSTSFGTAATGQQFVGTIPIQISKFLSLPTVRTLRTWLSAIAIRPGLLPAVLDLIKEQTKNWPLTERACCLVFDEISLKRNLQYDPKEDVIHGYVDDGRERTGSVANTAMLVLLRGIAKKWVQPVAFLTGDGTVRSGPFLLLLKQLISRLKLCNLFVKALVCDQGGSNCVVAKTLGVSPDRPFFVIEETKVYFIFDVPHLLKCTRNNLRKHDLQIVADIVSWKHIRTLYESTHHLKLKYVPKLTDKHIYESPFGNMKVKFASQAFSNSVYLAIEAFVAFTVLPPEATKTAEFVERMDQLFDTSNSSCVHIRERKMRHAISEQTEHINFLNSCISWIKGTVNCPEHETR
ncbi:uncharacterized protein LOC119395100 [Rhipicephalus sanguineus]|uniref:uncharacterized protein LOC119395100 n=1 Tax=Rhipicephalus sanguineus TaxID=34632 RepID=UPI001895AB17|nr:uncharacterized protein LOC119395100 [Rhipicephalus sanguineus]